MSRIVDRRNLDFPLPGVFGLEWLFVAPMFAQCDRDTVRQLRDAVQRMAEQVFLLCAAALDADPPRAGGWRSRYCSGRPGGPAS